MKIHCRIVRLGVLSFVLMFTLGCDTRARMGTYSYLVTLDEALRDPVTDMYPSIEVDFVGVKDAEIARWNSQDIDVYFKPGNLRRENADRYTMEFTDERSSAQTLSAGDRIWSSWKGANNMFIFASIPIRSSQYDVDPRRLVLPLNKARWDISMIELLIKPDEIVLRSIMKTVVVK